MSRLAVLLILAGVVLVGLISLLAQRLRWRKEKRFAETYLSKFRQLAERGTFDPALYDWLVLRSGRMQAQLGSLGMVEAYAATPYLPASLPTEALIVTTLPEMRSGQARPERIARCEDAMMQYLGTQEDQRAHHNRQLVNPLIWLGEGVRVGLLLPLLALHWLGLFKESSVRRFARHTSFRLFSGLVAVLGTVAAVLILVYGWDRFVELVAAWTAWMRP